MFLVSGLFVKINVNISTLKKITESTFCCK